MNVCMSECVFVFVFVALVLLATEKDANGNGESICLSKLFRVDQQALKPSAPTVQPPSGLITGHRLMVRFANECSIKEDGNWQ